MKLEIVFKDGRKKTFDNVTNFKVTETRYTFEVSQTPTRGKLFKVTPLEIDRKKFENPMSHSTQEWMRKTIQEAFIKVDINPKKYASPFYTLIPEENNRSYTSVAKLKKYSKDLGGQMGNWVEQALEWAQRISNGENWEDLLYNDSNRPQWRRIIVWKKGYAQFYGISNTCSDGYYYICNYFDHLFNTLPFVVLKHPL